MTTGEGGMLLTDRDDWADLARRLRNQGQSDDGSGVEHTRLGYNYRLDDLSAALGLAQVRRLDELLGRRAAAAARYDALLCDVDGVEPLAPARPGMSLSWFVYVVRLAPGLDRDALMTALAARGVASRPYFPPIHLQPLYRQRFGFPPGMFPHTEAAGASLLALPFHGNLQGEDIAQVCAVLAEEIARVEVTR